MRIGVFSISSPIHDAEVLDISSRGFLTEIENNVNYEVIDRGSDFSDYGDYNLNLIFIRTGGTEGEFKDLYERLKGPFYILSSGTNNSLPASMEILSFLRERGEQAEIIHGETKYIGQRITTLLKVVNARKTLAESRCAVIGAPSDWLIASAADYRVVREKLGMDIIDISIKELIEEVKKEDYPTEMIDYLKDDYDNSTLTGALHIYGALRRLIEKYELSGLTVRCFDLLSSIRNTSCLAMAVLNKEGIVAGCEGDVPSLLTMMIIDALTGKSGFMANPSSIDVERNELILAHCTVPLNMVESYSFDSHFESGIGIGIRGIIPQGDATVFKTDGRLESYFATDARIVRNLCSNQLCRTQIRVKPEKSVKYFLRESIGNHHIVAFGHNTGLIDEFFRTLPNVE